MWDKRPYLWLPRWKVVSLEGGNVRLDRIKHLPRSNMLFIIGMAALMQIWPTIVFPGGVRAEWWPQFGIYYVGAAILPVVLTVFLFRDISKQRALPSSVLLFASEKSIQIDGEEYMIQHNGVRLKLEYVFDIPPGGGGAYSELNLIIGSESNVDNARIGLIGGLGQTCLQVARKLSSATGIVLYEYQSEAALDHEARQARV